MTDTKHEFSKDVQKANIESVNETLAKLGGGRMKVTELFRDRRDGQSYIEKPPTMSIEDVVLQGSRIIEANAKMVDFTRAFKARPNDGAVAFAEVIAQTYGFGAVGKAIPPSFFSGGQRPEYKSVVIGFNEDGSKQTVEVPWGLMEFAPLQATFNLHYDMQPDYGFSFTVSVTAPKKNQEAINGLFALVDEYLKRNSIYRNKALFGVGRADPRTGEIVEPEFKNIWETPTVNLFFAESTFHQVDTAVFGIIEMTDLMREEGVKIGSTVLLEGENGTGKTEITIQAARLALTNGWSVIFSRFDEDITKVVSFAEEIGGPVLCVLEDCEKLMEEDDKGRMSELLHIFSSSGSPGSEVMLVMTTNHVTELAKSIMRAERIDDPIHVGLPDRDAIKGIINNMIAEDRREPLDYDLLFEAFKGMTASWISAAMKRAKRAAIRRTGEGGSMLATQDLITAAESMRMFHELHQNATDRTVKPTLETAFEELLERVVDARLQNHYVDNSDTVGQIYEVERV
jgi:hypothetical protein